MSLIFTAIVPNHPKLCQKGGATKTIEALKELEGELYFMKPDTIVLLTAYGADLPTLLNMNISSSFSCESLTQNPFHGDVEFAAHLKECIDVQQHPLPATIIAKSTILPEVATPLLLLLGHLSKCKVVVISTATLPLQDHFEFGDFLRKESLETNKRIAIIASGHLSKRKEETAKVAAQQSLDELCLRFFKEKQQEKILHINEELCMSSGSDLLKPLAVLLGVVHKLNVEAEILSYEQLYEEGQLVLNFILK